MLDNMLGRGEGQGVRVPWDEKRNLLREDEDQVRAEKKDGINTYYGLYIYENLFLVEGDELIGQH